MAVVALANLRPQEKRSYLLIENVGTNNILLFFGQNLDIATINVQNALILSPGGIFEPLFVPDNEIWALLQAVDQNGRLFYGKAEDVVNEDETRLIEQDF